MHGGVSGAYWFGEAAAVGATFVVRAGLRYAEGSAQDLQPRGGLGFLWRNQHLWGLQLDYAFVPMGELGAYHYATVGIVLPSPGERN